MSVLEDLEKEKALLIEKNEELVNRLTKVEARLANVEARDKPISFREAMRMLERHICFAAAGGSKTQFKKYYCLDKFKSAGDDMQSKLNAELSKLGLLDVHLTELAYLKDVGDFAIHHLRPQMTVAKWDASLVSDLDDSEPDEVATRKQLLQALWTYMPTDSTTGCVELRDPIVIPKLPVKKSTPL